MSLYNYPNWHEMKDHVMIYHEDEWDDAKIVVWDPIRQRHYKLIFTGSVSPDEDHVEGKSGQGEINFIVWPEKETFWDNVRLKITQFKTRIRAWMLKFEKNRNS